MPALLLVAFVAVPLAELYVIIQVAHVIGGWETIALLLAESFLGTWLVRREGRRTWRAFSTALQQRRAPAREVADGVLVIVGGTLLLTPGFLSDVVGFFVLLPVTRPLARRLLLRFAARRMGTRLGFPFGSVDLGRPSTSRRSDQSRASGRRAPGTGPTTGSASGTGPSAADAGVIEGEVVDEHVERPDRLRKPPDSGTPPHP